jgi:DNA repair exonuclease SbcCD ATPase subunit
MTQFAHLAEQHMIEFESRLKRIDELLERVNVDVSDEPYELASELKELTTKREELAGHIEKMRLKSLDDWEEKEIEKAGPMGVWDAVAQQIEKLVERIGS